MYTKPLVIAAALFVTLSLCWADDVIIPMDPWPPWKLVDRQSWEVDSQGVDNRLIEALLTAYNQAFGADLRASYQGTPYSHACVMRRVVEMGATIVPVGIRSLCRSEHRFLAQAGIDPISPRQCRQDAHQ